MALHRRETETQEHFQDNRHQSRKHESQRGKSTSQCGEGITEGILPKKKSKSKSEGSKLKSVDSECERMTEKLLMRHYASLNQFLKERQDSSIHSKGHRHHKHSCSSRASHHHRSRPSRTSSQLSLLTQCSRSSEHSRRCNKLRRSYNVARHCYMENSHRRHDGSLEGHSRRRVKGHFPVIKNLSESSLDYSLYTKNKGFMRAVKQASYLRRPAVQMGDHDKNDLNILYCSAGELRGVLQRVARRMAQEGWKPPNKKTSQVPVSIAPQTLNNAQTQINPTPVNPENPQQTTEKPVSKESVSRIPQSSTNIPATPPIIHQTATPPLNSTERPTEKSVPNPEATKASFGMPSFYPGFPSFFQYPKPAYASPPVNYDYYGGTAPQYSTAAYQSRSQYPYSWGQYMPSPTSNGDYDKLQANTYGNDPENDFYKSMRNEWSAPATSAPFF